LTDRERALINVSNKVRTQTVSSEIRNSNYHPFSAAAFTDITARYFRLESGQAVRQTSMAFECSFADIIHTTKKSFFSKIKIISGGEIDEIKLSTLHVVTK
jgi:hypothetical protein